MVNVSQAFKDELANDNRRYYRYVTITLSDNTVLEITNEHIWQGGWKYEESTSGSGVFEVGAFIIGKFTLVLNNIYGDYDDYDFAGATLVASIGLELPDETIETIRKGTYTVSDVTGQNSSLVTIEALDWGTKFNKEYKDSTLTYPATLWQIVNDACSECGVALGMENFRHSDYVIQTKPTDDTLTYGGVISAVAQIACQYVKMSPVGALVFGWYAEGPLLTESIIVADDNTPILTSDRTYITGTFPATQQDYLDGNIWNANVHRVAEISRENIAADDVVITGVRITYPGEETDQEILFGDEGYVLGIVNNPLIVADSAATIAQMMGEALIGLTFRPMELSILSDPTIETGDRAYVIDIRNRVYVTYINNLTFTAGAYEAVSCEAETPVRNNMRNLSAQTQTYQKLRQSIQSNAYEIQSVYSDLSQQIQDITGDYVSAEDFNEFQSDMNTQLDDIRSQITGSIEQWFGAYVPTDSNVPASNWTTEALKEEHQGDLFFDTTTGYSYRWLNVNSAWQWVMVSDTDVQTAIAQSNEAITLANVKRRCFTYQPVPPYDKGDIWMQGPNGDILVCTYGSGRQSGASFVETDWEKYNKYTDNTVADQALNLAQNHTHSEYALTNHTHSQYAPSNYVPTNVNTYNNGSRRGIGTGADNGERVSVIRTSDTVGRLVVNGQFSGTTYANYFTAMTSSDKRLKKNIGNTEVKDALKIISQMHLHSFDWIDGRHQKIGFIADELEQIDDSMAVGGGYDKDGTMIAKSVEVLPLIAYLTKGIQELSAQVQELTEQVIRLECELADK